mgnify:CR=1 FL=1
MFKNYKILYLFLIILSLISCNSETEESNKNDKIIDEVVIEKIEDDSKKNEILDDKDYSYVDWWPVKSESSDNDYKTSTSTIEIKKIPFPKKFNENED